MNSPSDERVLYRNKGPFWMITFIVMVVSLPLYYTFSTFLDYKELTLFDKFVFGFIVGGVIFILILVSLVIYKLDNLTIYTAHIRAGKILTTRQMNNLTNPTDILRFEDIEFVKYHKKKPADYLEIRDKNGLDYYFGGGLNLKKLVPILKSLLPGKFEEVWE